MNRRRISDKAFTIAAYVVFGLLTLALLLVLGPILVKGASAVLFRGTVEFRELQMDEHERGDAQALAEELEAAEAARAPVFQMIAEFRRGIDIDPLVEQAREANRAYGDLLRDQNVDRDVYRDRRRAARDIRNTLIEAYETDQEAVAHDKLDKVLAHREDSIFRDTPFELIFEMARDYRRIVESVDLDHRDEYGRALDEVLAALRNLLGPLPGEEMPALIMNQYGATRWDRAQVHLENVLWAEKWVPAGPNKPMVKKRVPREEQFAGTSLAPLFPLLEKDLDEMLRPRWTVHWQYFIDDSKASHFFGGVGPEIIGTVLLTILAILFAVPLGVVSAAYMIECGGDNPAILVIRTCINTLAGVPSIVFGLFGLAFFVVFLLPWLGLSEGSSILAGSLTLAVLVLPLVIRASEEAIRAVPHTYKEAALSLGAGQFWAFVTVTLPAALPGILTGIILSMSRAAGETAPILFTAAVALGPIPESIAQPTRALSYGSYDMAVGDRIAAMVPHKQFGMVMTLVVIVLVLNLAAILLRARISRKLRG